MRPHGPFTVADRPTALSLQALQAEDGDPTVRLHWPAQAGQRFRLQRTEATDLDFAKVAEDTVLDAPTWTASNLAAGEYLVRIQVLDASGLESDFSPPRKIRVGTGIRTGAGLPVSTSSVATRGAGLERCMEPAQPRRTLCTSARCFRGTC